MKGFNAARQNLANMPRSLIRVGLVLLSLGLVGAAAGNLGHVGGVAWWVVGLDALAYGFALAGAAALVVGGFRARPVARHMTTGILLMLGGGVVAFLTNFLPYFGIEAAIALWGAALVAFNWTSPRLRVVAGVCGLLILAGEAGGQPLALWLGAAGAIGAAIALGFQSRRPHIQADTTN